MEICKDLTVSLLQSFSFPKVDFPPLFSLSVPIFFLFSLSSIVNKVTCIYVYVLYIECVYLFLCHLYFLGDQADFWGLHSTRYLYKGFLFLVFPPLFFQSVSVYRIEKLGMANQYCSAGAGAQELHVLAVDDSLVDRKVIERLLKISSCKGLIFFFLNWGSFGSGI